MVARYTYLLTDSKSFLCSNTLDPDGHHALTCRSGGDTIVRHSNLRDCFSNLCSKACISPQLEKGPGINFFRPAVARWPGGQGGQLPPQLALKRGRQNDDRGAPAAKQITRLYDDYL